jgi:beta-lactamase regulating signal transducer with metallopeptidase domain
VWQNTAAALIVLALLRILKNKSPRLRHAIILIALLKFAIPPMLPLPTGIFSAAPPAPSIEPVRHIVYTLMNARTLVIALMLLHLAGAAFALARLLVEAIRLRGIRRRAIAIGNDIFLSDEIAVPMTNGRVILIPRALVNTLTRSELADVICHEREHIRRRDVLLNWLQEIVIALWWFHPLVHLLGREARTLREECCDDALLASGTCDTAHYARTLLQAATFTSRTPVAAAAIAESQYALLRRIRRIADRRFTPSRRMNAAAITLIVLLALTLLPGLRISAANRFAFDRATLDAIHHDHQH